MFAGLVASLLALLGAAAPPAASAQADADWLLLDGPGSGIVHLRTSANGVVFAVDANHGFFRSDDAGDTWQSVPGPAGGWPQLPDPTDPATLYGVSADGLYKSTDAGASWALLLPSPQPVRDLPWPHLAISPADHNVLYLAGPLAPCCTPSGLVRSQDGGRTWSTATTFSPSSFCLDTVDVLVPHPTDPRRVYSDEGCYAGRSLGADLSVSNDGGSTWSVLFREGQQQEPRLLVGGAGADPNRLYLATSHFIQQGPARVYRSDDGGATWTMVLEATDRRSLRFGGLAYNPDQPDEVFAAMGMTTNPDDTGVRVSEDGGASWAILGRPDLGWINDLVRLPNGTLLAATNEGIWRYTPAPMPPDAG